MARSCQCHDYKMLRANASICNREREEEGKLSSCVSIVLPIFLSSLKDEQKLSVKFEEKDLEAKKFWSLKNLENKHYFSILASNVFPS